MLRLAGARVNFKAQLPLKIPETLPRLLRGYCRSSAMLTSRSDISSTDRPPQVYGWLDDVEDLEGYVVGGYHPVQLGDELSQGRYRIIHKLGFGSYSTGKFSSSTLPAVHTAIDMFLSMARQRSNRKSLRRIEDFSRPRFGNEFRRPYLAPSLGGRHQAPRTKLCSDSLR